MAGKTISLRFEVRDADEAKRKLEELGRSGALSLDRINAAGAKAQQSIATAQAATGQAIANRFAGVQSTADTGEVERRRADAMAALGTEVDRLRSRYVPLVAEQQRYRETVQEIAAAERAGALSSQEATAALRAQATALAQTTAASSAAASARMDALRALADGGEGGEAEQRRAAAMAALGTETDRLRAKFVPLVAEQRRYEQTLEEIAAAERASALSSTEAAAARARANDTLVAATAATDANARATGQQRQQFAQLVPQINDVVASLGSGMSPLTILLQQGGQVTQIYGGVGATFAAAGRAAAAFAGPIGIGAVAAGFALMAVSAERAERKLEDLTQRARATRDDFADAAKEINAAAKAAAATGSIGKADATAAAQAIRTSAGFSGTESELTDLIRVSQDLSRVMGEGVAESAARVAKGFDSAHDAAQELASKGFRTLDVQTVRSIERLQNQGKAAEATALLLDKVRQATAGADEARTPFEQGMRDLAKAFTGVEQSASDFIKTIGTGLADAFGTALSAVAGFITDSKRMFGELRDIVKSVVENPGVKSYADAQVQAYNDALAPTMGPNRGATGTVGLQNAADTSLASRMARDLAPAGYAATRDRIARELGLDPEYGRRLQRVENAAPRADGTWAVSSAGARGPLQLLPGTFNDMQKKYGFRGGIDDPEANTYAGFYYAREQLMRRDVGGDAGRSYWGYNNGPGVYQTGRPSPAAIEGAARLTAGYTGTPLQGYVLPQPPSREQLQRQQESRRQIDGADRLVQDRYSGLDRDRQNIRDDITRLRGAMENADASPEQLREYAAAIAEATGKLNELLTPQEAFIRGLKDQNAPLAAVTEGERVLADVRQRMAEIERSTGTQFSAAQRREAEAAALAGQNAQFTKLLVNLDQETVNQVKLADAYARGHGEVAKVQAETKAYAQALELVGGTGGDFRATMDALTEAYRNQAEAAAEAKIAASTAENRDELDYIQRQTELIGASGEERSRELALLRARQELIRSDISLESEHAQAYLSSVAAMSEANSRLERMNEAFAEIQNIGTQAFDKIGERIADAFVSGGDKALDFGDIVKDVLKQVIQQITRLAVINPIINTLFGGNRATLSDVGGLLGGLGGGSGSSVSAAASLGGLAGFAGGGAGGSGGYGGADATGSAGGGGLINTISGNIKSLGQVQSVYKGLSGSGSTGTGLGFVDSVLGYQLVQGGGTAATTSALGGLGSGVYGPATASQVTAAAGGYVPSGVTVGGALSGAATIGGGIYSAYQGFKQGGTGGTIQGVTGVAGTAIAGAGLAASAGLLGSGALAAGAAAAGPYAPLVIAAGVILSSLLGGKVKNPYSTTSIDAVGGRLEVGRTDSQKMDATEARAQAATDIANFNKFLDAAKVDVLASTYYDKRNPNRVFGIGENVTGFNQAKSFEEGVPQLRFKSEDPYLNKVLQDRGFASSQEFTTFVTNARVEIDALKETLEGLRDPLRDPENAGNMQKAIEALNETYDEARTGAEKYGMSVEGLTEAQVLATETVLKELVREVDETQRGISIRGVRARGDTQTAELYDFDLSAEQQRRSWKKQMLDLWGDAFETTGDFRARMNVLEETLAAERLQIVERFAEEATAVEAERAAAERERIAAEEEARRALQERVAGAADAVESLWTRLTRARGDPQAADLRDQQRSGMAEWQAMSTELIAIYGESYRQTEDFAARMALLEETLGAERAAIVQRYADEAASGEQRAAQERLAAQAQAEQDAARAREEAERNARDAATGVLSNLADYAKSLRRSDANPASPLAQYDDAVRQFQAVSGAAQAGDFRSASELTGYADTLLAASREINGSGLAYAQDFDRVASALQGVADVQPDILTASAAAEQSREQTAVIADQLTRLRDEVVALRRELAQQARAA